MTSLPGMPSIPGGGSRAEKAGRMMAQAEAKKKRAQAQAEVQVGAAAAQQAGAQLHGVRQSETLEDIAATYDVTPDEIWEHPRNQQLRERRGAPSELQAGDALYIPGQKQEQLEPVGQGDYVVQEGDCIASIAKDTGHFWETIWDDPANSKLKEVRQDPEVLLAGDRVTIPEIHAKQEPGESEMRHRFVRKGEPASLNLRLTVEEKPLANEPFQLIVDGNEHRMIKGTTDAGGNLSVMISGNAREALLRVGTGEEQLVYQLDLGNVNPRQDLKGIQRRLANLGFAVSDSGDLDYATREALREFQDAAGLPATGEPDAATEAKLRELHGS